MGNEGIQRNDDSSIFMVKARRCKRCGGLLTRNEAIIDGYGHICKTKNESERQTREPMHGQITINDLGFF